MGRVDDLVLFVEVIEAGSLAAASRKTGIPKSTLSRRLDDLEKSLGVHLLHRDPRRFSATEVGSLIYEHGRMIQQELGSVATLVESHTQKPGGTLRITCPAVLAELAIVDYAIEFAKEYPDVRITLDTTVSGFSARIDHYDIALQPAREALANSDLIRKKVASAAYCLVAAPGLMKRLGPGRPAPDDLNGWPGIGWSADEQSSRWRLTDGAGSNVELDVTLAFNASNLNIIKKLCLSGLGLARLPRIMCEDDLKNGRLVLPLSNWAPPAVTVYALYPSRRSLSFAGSLFITGLIGHLRLLASKDVNHDSD